MYVYASQVCQVQLDIQLGGFAVGLVTAVVSFRPVISVTLFVSVVTPVVFITPVVFVRPVVLFSPAVMHMDDI